jgi:hypothetical protein
LVIGIIRDATGTFNGGLVWLALMALMSIVVITIIFSLWGKPESVLGALEEAR